MSESRREEEPEGRAGTGLREEVMEPPMNADGGGWYCGRRPAPAEREGLGKGGEDFGGDLVWGEGGGVYVGVGA